METSTPYLGFFLRHQQRIVETNDTRTRTYGLDPRLFAINEPYLMPTERNGLLNLKKCTAGHDDCSKNKSCRKRKRALEKKLDLMHGTLSRPEERSAAERLISRNLERSVAGGMSDGLLKSLDDGPAAANAEAQNFVQSLFRNRFEALNYRDRLLFNPCRHSIKVKLGLSHYLIPERCSFAGTDVLHGVQALHRHLKSSVSRPLICKRHPFLILMDPAWYNKSVKRTRVYDTVDLDYLLRLCRHIDSLMDSLPPGQSSVCAVWTTELNRMFVIDKMLPLLRMKASHILKWHKVTQAGLPVKVHGGAEYLVVARRTDPAMSGENSQPQPGLIVSVPSAIHSHKPIILALLDQLLGHNSQCFGSQPAAMSNEAEHHCQAQLSEGEFIEPLCGLELFARYLQSGFHSIGFECIKLQNAQLFGEEVTTDNATVVL